MLVFDRTIGQGIVIDDKIEIEVVKIYHINGKRRVKLGITAPKDVSVHRKEIQEQIKQEKSANIKTCVH